MGKSSDYLNFKLTSVSGRYVTNKHIYEFLSTLDESFHLDILGLSVKKRPIYGITIGHGPKRIFMWSQMHGNESTTTKAVLDLLNFIKQSSPSTEELLNKVTLKIIPILNPDGAFNYTRFNANEVDLNRDAQKRKQPESKILRKAFNKFAPHYCFNLHDQRTIFNVGNLNYPATVSFLAPAFDRQRNNSESRTRAMCIIAAMNQKLQDYIPGQVGRFDDSFNPNCVGDTFQMQKVPTILFEAGHYQEDYQREKTREFIWYALCTAIRTIANDEINNFSLNQYYKIPENNKRYVDILVENAHVLDNSLNEKDCVSILYKEVLNKDKINFIPTLVEKGFKPGQYFGHKTLNCLIDTDANWLRSQEIKDWVY